MCRLLPTDHRTAGTGVLEINSIHELIYKIEKINEDKFKVFYTSLDKDVVPKRRKRFEQKRLNNMTIN